MLTRTRGGVPDGPPTADHRRGEPWSLMASLRAAQRDQLDTAERVAALRTLAPVPAPKLVRRTRPHNYRRPLAFAALMGVFTAVTWVAPVTTLQSVGEAATWLEVQATPSGQAIATTLFIAVGAVGLAIAWARATALARPIRLPSGGQISVEAVASQLQSLILESDTVNRADVRVDNLHRRGVRVGVRLHVTSHADLNHTVEAVCEQTEWFLHAHLLVRLSSIPSVELSFDELDLRSGRVHDGTAHTASG